MYEVQNSPVTGLRRLYVEVCRGVSLFTSEGAPSLGDVVFRKGADLREIRAVVFRRGADVFTKGAAFEKGGLSTWNGSRGRCRGPRSAGQSQSSVVSGVRFWRTYTKCSSPKSPSEHRNHANPVVRRHQGILSAQRDSRVFKQRDLRRDTVLKVEDPPSIPFRLPPRGTS